MFYVASTTESQWRELLERPPVTLLEARTTQVACTSLSSSPPSTRQSSPHQFFQKPSPSCNTEELLELFIREEYADQKEQGSSGRSSPSSDSSDEIDFFLQPLEEVYQRPYSPKPIHTPGLHLKEEPNPSTKSEKQSSPSGGDSMPRAWSSSRSYPRRTRT